jgi:hypothetical protein
MDTDDADEPGQDRSYRPKYLPTSTDASIGKHRAALGEAAAAGVGTKDTYLQAQSRRLAARRGKKRALVAVGHAILVATWHMISNEVDYQDLGSAHFVRRVDPVRQTRRLVDELHASEGLPGVKATPRYAVDLRASPDPDPHRRMSQTCREPEKTVTTTSLADLTGPHSFRDDTSTTPGSFRALRFPVIGIAQGIRRGLITVAASYR